MREGGAAPIRLAEFRCGRFPTPHSCRSRTALPLIRDKTFLCILSYSGLCTGSELERAEAVERAVLRIDSDIGDFAKCFGAMNCLRVVVHFQSGPAFAPSSP